VPVVTIEWYEGRSDELKAEIAEQVTDVLVANGVARDQVWLKFVDLPKKDWAIGGVKNPE
jgi:phenylpyruvate tautomerase PptA (4-oxalocrotonate tautomerase family)